MKLCLLWAVLCLWSIRSSFCIKKYWANYYSINCGGSEHTSIEGIIFREDFKNAGTPVSNNRVFLNVNWKDQSLYQTLLLKDFFGHEYQGSLKYTIPAETSGEFMFGLKLAHPGSQVCNRTDFSARFNVSLNDEVIIRNIDLCDDCRPNMACDDLIVFFNITDDIMRIETLEKDYERPVAVRDKKIILKFLPIESASVVVNAFFFLRKKNYSPAPMVSKSLDSADRNDFTDYYSVNCGGGELTSSQRITYHSDAEASHEFDNATYRGVAASDQDLYRYFVWVYNIASYNISMNLGTFLVGFKFGHPNDSYCGHKDYARFNVKIGSATVASNVDPCGCGSAYSVCDDIMQVILIDDSSMLKFNNRDDTVRLSNFSVVISVEGHRGRSVMMSAFYILRYSKETPPPPEVARRAQWDGKSLTVPPGISETHSAYTEYVVHSDFPEHLKLFLLFFIFLLLLFVTVAGYW